MTAEILASYYDSKAEYKDAISYYKKAAQLNTLSKDYATDIFQAYYYGFRRGQFSLDELKAAANNALASKTANIEDSVWIFYFMSNLIAKKNDDLDLIRFIKEGQSFFTSMDNNTFRRQKEAVNILFTIYIEKAPDKAIELKKASMPEGWDENAGNINSFSWWCFEHKINLDEAETLARKGVELAESGGEKAMILDTVAEIVNLKGNPTEAVELTRLAIKESPERKFYQEQLKRFEKLIE